MTQVTLTLPDDLVQQAQRAGLLQPQAMETLLREAMRERRVERLFETMEKLRELKPRLSEEEIDAEIATARAERRAQHVDRH